MKWFSLPFVLSTSLMLHSPAFAESPDDQAPELPMQGPMLEAPSAEGDEPSDPAAPNPLRRADSIDAAPAPVTEREKQPEVAAEPPTQPVKTYATSVPVIDLAASHVQVYPTFVGYGAIPVDPYSRGVVYSRWCCEPPPGYMQHLWADYCNPREKHGRCGHVQCRPCQGTCRPVHRPCATCPSGIQSAVSQPVVPAPHQVLEVPVSTPTPTPRPAATSEQSPPPAPPASVDETARRRDSRGWARGAKSIKEIRSGRPIRISHQTGRAG